MGKDGGHRSGSLTAKVAESARRTPPESLRLPRALRPRPGRAAGLRREARAGQHALGAPFMDPGARLCYTARP